MIPFLLFHHSSKHYAFTSVLRIHNLGLGINTFATIVVDIQLNKEDMCSFLSIIFPKNISIVMTLRDRFRSNKRITKPYIIMQYPNTHRTILY